MPCRSTSCVPGVGNTQLSCETFRPTATFVSKISKSHISYAHLLELKPQSQPGETLRNAELDILSPQMSLRVCVCVCLQVGVSSATAVMRWHVDLSLSIAPRTPDPPQSNMSVPPPTTDEVVTITGTHHISPLTIITNDSNDLTQCFRWPPPNPCHDTGGGPPALLFLCVWLCSQQPHLLRVNTTLGTISPPLAKLLLTLFNWGLIACQQDVALAESLTRLLLILMIHPGLNHQE